MTALLYIVGLLVVLAGIALSIGLHEIGHLLPAKLFNVRVTQYMIGFGRTVFRRTRGETEYGVKMIPLGGYISMVGMFPPSKAQRRARLFEAAPTRSGSAAGTLGATIETAIEADETEPAGRGPAGYVRSMVRDARRQSQEQIRPGEEHRAFYMLPVWKRIVIMLGGPTMNLILGILFFGIAMSGIGSYAPTTTVASVSKCIVPASAASSSCQATDPAAPANAAGMRPGDVILRIDGSPISDWNQETAAIRASAHKRISVEIRRDGRDMTLTMTPVASQQAKLDAAGNEVKTADGTLETVDVGVIGVLPVYALQQQPVTAVLPAVWGNVTEVGNIILHLPQRLVETVQATFGDGTRNPNGPISVVGVGEVAGEITSAPGVALASKIAALIGILGSLNIALFVFNLIPLLPLDGGHIIGALWEALKRGVAKLAGRADPGPVDTAMMMPVTVVVAVLLGGMSALLIAADLIHPIQLF